MGISTTIDMGLKPLFGTSVWHDSKCAKFPCSPWRACIDMQIYIIVHSHTLQINYRAVKYMHRDRHHVIPFLRIHCCWVSVWCACHICKHCSQQKQTSRQKKKRWKQICMVRFAMKGLSVASTKKCKQRWEKKRTWDGSVCSLRYRVHIDWVEVEGSQMGKGGGRGIALLLR